MHQLVVVCINHVNAVNIKYIITWVGLRAEVELTFGTLTELLRVSLAEELKLIDMWRDFGMTLLFPVMSPTDFLFIATLFVFLDGMDVASLGGFGAS